MLDERRFSPGPSWLGTLAGLLTLIGGVGLLIQPYWLYGWMVTLLPWEAFLLMLCWAAGAAVSPAKSRSRRRDMILAVIAAAVGGVLLYRPDWRDMALWYLFNGWMIFTAAVTLLPAQRQNC